MADLNEAIDFDMGIEGFYSKDPNDAGGETIWSIARKKNPQWKGWPIVDILKSHPDFPNNCRENQQLIRLRNEFLAANFWGPIGGDGIEDQALANQVLRMAVNSGVHEALLLLKES